tara:strand:+ start:2092 stop:2493 length:402 start_codon:yes stop_codon:yes gene_type:complete
MKKPSLYRRFIMWVVDSWRLVMDTRYNPLKYIADPSLQTYFLLVLFTMWSVYFGFLATFYMGWLGYSIPISIGIHVLVILPIAFTNAVFMDAEKNGAQWLKDWRHEQMNWKFWQNRPSKKGKNIIHWDIDKEA